MVLTIGQIGFFATAIIAVLYVVFRVITGNGLPDDDGVFMLMMSPIGGFLLGCIIGNTVETFGVFIGAVLCGVFVLFFVVQYLRLRAKEWRKITMP